MDERVDRYVVVDKVDGVAPNSEGENVVIDCRIEGRRCLLAFSAEDASTVGLYMMVGTQLCPYIRDASEVEKVDPAFRSALRNTMKDILAELLARLTPDISPPQTGKYRFDA
jgi:hypothetical protein